MIRPPPPPPPAYVDWPKGSAIFNKAFFSCSSRWAFDSLNDAFSGGPALMLGFTWPISRKSIFIWYSPFRNFRCRAMAAFLPGIGLAVVCLISYSVVSISARSLRIYTVIALGMFLIFDTKKIIPGKSSNFGVRGPKDAYFDTCPGTLWLALEKISTLFGSSRENLYFVRVK